MDSESLNRFDRIVAMLQHLQSGRTVKAQELADRFQVSLRTVYRDIRSLEASGVPVTGEAGVGYSLLDGYRLPPVMFTHEEAGSFVAAEKLMQKFSDKALGAHFESAMYKVKSVLRGSAKDRVAALEAQIWVDSSTTQLFNQHTPHVLDVLFDSMALKKQVALQYQAFSAEEATERLIEPVGLFHENNFWYIMGYCHLREDYRQFRTDRMLQIKLTDRPFSKEHGPLSEYRKPKSPSEKVKVVLRVEKKFAKYIQTSRNYYGFVSEEVAEEYVEMTFMTDYQCEGMARWFLMFGDCAQILEPESLKQQVSDIIARVQASLALQPEPIYG
ncbi:WYL domain-containing protein [Nibribacter ruber]|uniref:WYL domain-containing protein n=1 Tax=Nibribacter ruber TaxID=2698458 RepID=A0A6P1NX91_9BACT|nr:YafY family protein [Nibribacter ruber]QHL88297.1 WYL domain-containing protein [Nibribacter ruber]